MMYIDSSTHWVERTKTGLFLYNFQTMPSGSIADTDGSFVAKLITEINATRPFLFSLFSFRSHPETFHTFFTSFIFRIFSSFRKPVNTKCTAPKMNAHAWHRNQIPQEIERAMHQTDYQRDTARKLYGLRKHEVSIDGTPPQHSSFTSHTQMRYLLLFGLVSYIHSPKAFFSR